MSGAARLQCNGGRWGGQESFGILARFEIKAGLGESWDTLEQWMSLGKNVKVRERELHRALEDSGVSM